jgi:hypothetical protein
MPSDPVSLPRASGTPLPLAPKSRGDPLRVTRPFLPEVGETTPAPPRLPSSGGTSHGPSPAARVIRCPEAALAPAASSSLLVRVDSRTTAARPAGPAALLRLLPGASGGRSSSAPPAAPPAPQKSFLSILDSCMHRVLQPLPIAPRPMRLSACAIV